MGAAAATGSAGTANSPALVSGGGVDTGVGTAADAAALSSGNSDWSEFFEVGFLGIARERDW